MCLRGRHREGGEKGDVIGCVLLLFTVNHRVNRKHMNLNLFPMVLTIRFPKMPERELVPWIRLVTFFSEFMLFKMIEDKM